jgi:16S rRNA (cytosine1402-N4)-methyltransferase
VTVGGALPHEPVMVTEVTEFLQGRRTVVDMTVGSGGHAGALLDAGVDRVIGVDRDPSALELAGERLASYGARFRPIASRFSEVDEATVGSRVEGVLYDLGVSSMQLDRPERGFGYRVDGPLDMRMGEEVVSAADLVNGLPEEELANLIFELGQERRSRPIARAIVRARPIDTTDALARVIAGAVGRRPGGPHPARRTFQALRIAVNREIEELAASLPRAVDLLVPGGRVVVISYHSLEDGLVKRTFRGDDRLAVLTKHPQTPSEQEVARNPRSRAAKLRAAERSGQAA